MSSVVLAADNQIIHGILNRLQVLNLVEFHEKGNPSKFVQIPERFSGGDAEPLAESPDTSICVWYLKSGHSTKLSIILEFCELVWDALHSHF